MVPASSTHAASESAVDLAAGAEQDRHDALAGALANLGHEVGRNAIKRILKAAGIEPAPERAKRTQWKTFLTEHLGAICAAEFFTVEPLTMTGVGPKLSIDRRSIESLGVCRYFVLFVIDLKMRQVHVAGIAYQVYGKWVEQVARNLTDAVDGFLKDMRYLIHDREPVFTKHFAEILASAGVETVKLPARSPNANAYVERFVRSIKDECLRRIIPLGEVHLRRIAGAYVEHCHEERNHQSLDNRLIVPRVANENGAGPVLCQQRLGGMLRFYYRNAA